jgi:type I restriction enzyme S subunit
MYKVVLGDVCEKIGSGATPRGGSDVYLPQGEIALIRSQNVHNNGFKKDGLAFISEFHAKELNNVAVEPNDILLNITGDSVARCCQVPDDVLPARVNQHVAIIRPKKEKLDSRYLRYYLIDSTVQDYMLVLAGGGATRNALTKGMIESFEIPVLPLPEQRAIAGILGALDDKIELNRRMNRTLESLARAVFRRWFVENEDVRNWRVGRLVDDFNLTMGQSPPGETYNEDGEGMPFFQGRADFGFRFPANRVYCTAPTRFAEEGDTLVSVRAPVGDMNMATEKSAIGRGVAAVRHKSGSRSYTYYAMHMLQEDFFRFEGEGTVFGSINRSDFENLKIAIPPTDKVKEFERLCFSIDQMIENNEKESRTLASLRDSLLPKLMRGEVRVKDVDKLS